VDARTQKVIALWHALLLYLQSVSALQSTAVLKAYYLYFLYGAEFTLHERYLLSFFEKNARKLHLLPIQPQDDLK